MTPSSELDPRRSLRRHLLAASVIGLLLVGGVGGWAATTDLSGAVIAEGQLVVENNVKKVQHLTGGIVGELHARDGDKVTSGSILVRLDDTQTRANLAIYVKNLTELTARQARDEAERDGADTVVFPDELLARMDDPDVAKVVRGEATLFSVRKAAREGQKSQLRERIVQQKEEIKGLSAQIDSKIKQIEWIHKELEGIRDLWKKNLIPYTRLTSLEREAARLEGEQGQLVASIAQARGKISETELQIIQVDQDLRTEVSKDLAEIRGKISETVERRITAEDQLKRVDIRAPIDGTVHQSIVHTVGGVINAGEVLMLIVPASESLTVEARIRPQDIDQVRLEQHAMLRFSAFNQRTTPELNALVSRVSADVVQDQKTSTSYYLARIAIPDSEIARLGGLKLVMGMPVEVFIQTGERSVVSYITKPLRDQIARAFREK